MAFRRNSGGFENASVGQILTAPLRLVWGFVVFMVMSWTTSRSGRAFVLAIPAMLTGLMCLAVFWVVSFYGDRRSNVSAMAEQSFHAENNPDHPEYAEMYARKIVDLIPDEDYFKYSLGLAYDTSEKRDEAIRMMEYLAPIDRPGFPLAHIWQSNYYRLVQTTGLDDKERDSRAKKHLELALEIEPENISARVGLANVFGKEADSAETVEDQISALTLAAENFEKAGFDTRLQSSLQFLAMTDYLETMRKISEKTEDSEESLKIMETANQRAQKAIRLLHPISFRAPNFFPTWITLVKCCVFLGNFDLATEYIQNGFQLATDPPVRQEIARLAAQILIEQSDEYKDMNDEDQFRKRLFALCDAIATDFRLEVAYIRLIDFFDKDTVTKEQDIWLRDSMVGSDNTRIPGVIHMLLGMRDISEGNFADGQKHWEIANQQFPFAQYAINILIRVYSKEKQLAFDDKINFLTVALELFPQQPALYVTRGEFHKEAEHYEKAAEDLEIAAKDLPKMVSVSRDLAECYEELGNEKKALEYKKKVERLLAELDAQQRGIELPTAPPSDEEEEKNEK